MTHAVEPKFRVLARGESTGRGCIGCPETEAVSLCGFVEQTRWWEGTFDLCDACMEKVTNAWVYFIRAGDVVKIGYSADPARRLRDLTTGSPVPLELWHRTPGTEQDERDLHLRFADERLHGEWFQVSDRIREFVESPTYLSEGATA